MLPHIAYQQHAVACLEPVQKLIHLLRARETRFVENVQPLLSVLWLVAVREMPLQCARFDSGLAEFLCCAGCRREAFHFESFALGGFPDRSQRSRLSCTGTALEGCYVGSGCWRLFSS